MKHSSNKKSLSIGMIYKYGLVLGFIFSIVLYNVNVIIPVLFANIEYLGSFFLSIFLIILIFILASFLSRVYSFEFPADDLKEIATSIFIYIFIGSIIAYLIFAFILYPFISKPLYILFFKSSPYSIDTSIMFIIYESLNNLYYAFQICIIFFLVILYKFDTDLFKKTKRAVYTDVTFLIYPLILATLSSIIDLLNQTIYFILFSTGGTVYTSIIVSNVLYLIKVALLVLIVLYLIIRYNVVFESRKIKRFFVISFLAIFAILVLFSLIIAPYFGQINGFFSIILQDLIWGFYLNCIFYTAALLKKVYPDFEIFY